MSHNNLDRLTDVDNRKNMSNNDNQKTTSNPVESLPPAIKVALTGNHLIEASAGTGKTWTLTGIVLRLLIEARRAPEQIIATTFTRAAAAEMRERVHARLIDFYQVLQWVNAIHAHADSKVHLYPKELIIVPEILSSETGKQSGQLKSADDNENESSAVDAVNPDIDVDILRKQRNEWLVKEAESIGIKEIVADPINLHLLGYLLDRVYSYSLDEALKRTALVLTTLDKLFIGTLDSLAQKWLNEYSAETGHQPGMVIVEDEKNITDSIIHDEIRQFQSRLYRQQPKIYEILDKSNRLTTVADHQSTVDKALKFISAPIDEVATLNSFDFDDYQQLLTKFSQIDLSDIEPYFNEDYRKSQGFAAGKGILYNKITTIVEIQQKIAQFNTNFMQFLSEDAYKFLNELKNSQYASDDGKIKGFKKNFEAQHQTFYQLESVKTLIEVYDANDRLNTYIDNLLLALNRKIAISVRQKLPVILEERQETTFTLQMVRLNQALAGNQGAKLARYIRHHYPVALIDESQDINGEQALMIKQIYLSQKNQSKINNSQSDNKQHKEDNGFLLLVGDPKQAIYGFRGGDVANYNDIKNQFNNANIMTLDINRRSNAGVIDALNYWFGCGQPKNTANTANTINVDGKNSGLVVDKEATVETKRTAKTMADRLAQLGDNIYYRYIEAVKKESDVSWQNGHNTIAKDDILEQENNKSASQSAKQYQNQSDKPLQQLAIGIGQHLDNVKISANCQMDIVPHYPVSIIHLNYDKEAQYDEYEVTALHIYSLLADKQTYKGRALAPSDIAVLGRRRKDLKQVEDMLVKLNVPTLKTSEVSIFETVMAADVAALLAVMLHPYHRGMLNRTLTSSLYGLSLAEVKAMMNSYDAQAGQAAEIEVLHSAENKAQKSYQNFISYIKEGAARWQQYGVLSALNFLLDKNPIGEQGVWQTLAGLPDGERYIMDLRHIMDILAEYSIGKGEFELLSWYQNNMNSLPTSDWARQHPLPTESGVQLMTIHKSKGLEFPVVYVLGMDKASRDVSANYALYLYNQENTENHSSESTGNNLIVNQSENQQNKQLARKQSLFGARRLSAQKGNLKNSNYFVDKENKEGFDEFKRLGYVAFTRASQQLYMVLKDAYNTKDVHRKPASFWLQSNDKTFTLPDRLQGKIGWLQGKKIIEHYQSITANPFEQGDINLAEQIIVTEQIKYPSFASIMPKTYFKGWSKTSFTALSRQLDDTNKPLAVNDERIDDDIYINTLNPQNSSANDGSIDDDFDYTILIDSQKTEKLIKPANDIRFTFVKGANAGTFLHEVFEKIDFVDKTENKRNWSEIIDRGVHSYQLPLIYASAEQQKRGLTEVDDSQHVALKDWISEVLNTPLLASNQPLISIAPSQRFAELGFNMGLADTFRAQDINDLFTTYLPDDVSKHLRLTANTSPHLYRYLRGEIDLVYEHAGKFYVVDYKSNYLGNSLSNYNQNTLNDAMSKAGYWLQAAIYQVALHRFLSLRIEDYLGNENKYLGAVEYVFLRGVYSEQTNKELSKNNNESQRFGLVTWDIPIDFIKALDDLFGKP